MKKKFVNLKKKFYFCRSESDKQVILMSIFSIHSFFIDLLSIQCLDIKIVVIVGGVENEQIQISVLNAFDSNDIDVGSCRRIGDAAFFT